MGRVAYIPRRSGSLYLRGVGWKRRPIPTTSRSMPTRSRATIANDAHIGHMPGPASRKLRATRASRIIMPEPYEIC